jgi:hypothetical protein
MYQDDVLRETWRIKDQLADEYARDPDAYWAKLRQISETWKRRGGGATARPTPRRTAKRPHPSISKC